MEVSRIRFMFKVLLKSAMPEIFSGIKVGVSMGWMSVIAAEMISGQSGLGYSIQLNRLNMQYHLMIFDMVAIAVIGFLLYEVVNYLEKYLLSWHDKTRHELC